jgi:MIP family channel proteins
VVGVGLVFGLVIMVMVYATGHLSGAHINPAVTIAFTLTRHFPARDALAYIGAQLAGATAAALVLLGVWTDKPAHLGATVPTVGAGSAVLYEALLTAFLMFVIMAVATDTRAVGAAAAIAIGGTIGLDALLGGPVTGASMNPARSFGPALASGEWREFWVYMAGPVIGGAVGALAYQLVRGEHPDAAPVPATHGRGSGLIASDLMANVLFVCLHNAGRSQMSQALFATAANGRHEVQSAGTTPGDRVHPAVVDAMRELGIDLSDRRPRALTMELAEWADVVVTMGCGDACPYIPGKRYIDWDLPDPKDLPLDEVRTLRDDIDGRVRELVGELDAVPPGS